MASCFEAVDSYYRLGLEYLQGLSNPVRDVDIRVTKDYKTPDEKLRDWKVDDYSDWILQNYRKIKSI